jgi:hypothetical protein
VGLSCVWVFGYYFVINLCSFLKLIFYDVITDGEILIRCTNVSWNVLSIDVRCTCVAWL